MEKHTPENDAPRLCPKCLGLGGWPCDTDMPHYVIPPGKSDEIRCDFDDESLNT